MNALLNLSTTQGATNLGPVALDDAVRNALTQNPWIVFNLSGGKDSAAVSHAASVWLDAIGHPRERRIAVHADLGRIEWKSTPGTVESTAGRLGVPLMIVRRNAGDLITRWKTRFANAKTRYEALETYRLIQPWSHANQRFCTSELKAQVIGPALSKRFRGETVIQVVGIRREESTNRAKTPISAFDNRHAKPGNRHGTQMLLWHPGVDFTTAGIFAAHAEHGIPLHEAYTIWTSTRLSCAFCVLGSLHDLTAAAACPDNRDAYFHLVSIEADSTFSFQPNRWLADIAPQILPASLAADIARAKRDALERQTLEALLPKALSYAKVWPDRLPDMTEAALIAQARRPILLRHGLEDRYPDAPAVIARFAELIALRAAA